MSDWPPVALGAVVPACRQCGCTEKYACIVEVLGINRGCQWVEPDLCSACSGAEKLVARGPAAGLSPLALDGRS